MVYLDLGAANQKAVCAKVQMTTPELPPTLELPPTTMMTMVPKKKTRKKRGHRQELTRITIDSISFGGKTLSAE